MNWVVFTISATCLLIAVSICGTVCLCRKLKYTHENESHKRAMNDANNTRIIVQII